VEEPTCRQLPAALPTDIKLKDKVTAITIVGIMRFIFAPRLIRKHTPYVPYLVAFSKMPVRSLAVQQAIKGRNLNYSK
jgi:hypothetical protein